MGRIVYNSQIEDLFLLMKQEGLNSTCRYCGQQVGLIQLDHTSAPRTASLLVVQFATNQPYSSSHREPTSPTSPRGTRRLWKHRTSG